jgi:uncharacterized protein (TIGR00730 family)
MELAPDSPDRDCELNFKEEFYDVRRRLQALAIRDAVIFFGSARVPEPAAQPMPTGGVHPDLLTWYTQAQDLAYSLGRWIRPRNEQYGKNLVLGSGGGPGIMEACNRGAQQAGLPSLGLNIIIPTEQKLNPYVTEGLSFDFQTFMFRKYWFRQLMRAVVIFPGGLGTLDELVELLNLISTQGFHLWCPVVLLGRDFWKRALGLPFLLEQGTVSPRDLARLYVCDTPQEATEALVPGLEEFFQA